MKNKQIIKGKIPALVSIYKNRLQKTLFIKLQEGGKIVVHEDGTIYVTRISEKYVLKKLKEEETA